MTNIVTNEVVDGRASSPPPSSPTTTTLESRIRTSLSRIFGLRYGMVWVLLLTFVFARVIYTQFLDPQNLNNMVAQVTPTAIVAVGMTFAIICGGFDLSAAAVFAGASVVYASLSNSMPLWLAFLCTILIGIINGLAVTVLKVNSFIATLATASLFSGATYWYSDSQPVVSTKAGFETLGTGKWGGIWVATWVLVVVIGVFGFILARTVYGRSIYSVGGNLEASRLAGMRVNVVRTSTFAIVSMCAALGGMIVASQTSVGQANARRT
ncbi:ABC transporter permease [Parafrankia sp. FMc2]|uniref:ABC transporter permease n=1 Tax=Parafrankia sp. FMc2 TaxID=3233196 RepID=UPI0034D4BE6A